MSQMCLLIFRIILFESFVALSGDADVGLTVALSEIRRRSNFAGGMDINTCPGRCTNGTEIMRDLLKSVKCPRQNAVFI